MITAGEFRGRDTNLLMIVDLIQKTFRYGKTNSQRRGSCYPEQTVADSNLLSNVDVAARDDAVKGSPDLRLLAL